VDWSGPGFRAGSPIVAGGTVWDLSRGGELYAFDPSSGQVRFQTFVGAPATSFPSLSAAGGRLFVPAGARIVAMGG
jgi:outer membrane protein assembly factor BamB